MKSLMQMTIFLVVSAASTSALLVASATRSPTDGSLATRRSVLQTLGLSLATAAAPASAKSDFKWGPMAAMSTEQMDALDEQSRAASAGVLLPSGVRVIDMVVGDGREPRAGDRVYAHYKVWGGGGFRSGPAADWSFQDGRPYGWTLGEPTDRLPPGVAIDGAAGMKEGGWRRLVVPANLAFGKVGLRKINYGPAGRYVGAKAPYVIKPGEDAYFDLIMLDGGSGRCEALLRPPGASEAEARKLRSMTCSYKQEIF